MKSNLKYREKMILGIIYALDNEDSYLRKYRLIGKVLGVLGGFFLGLTVVVTLQSCNSIIIWFIVISSISGLSIGLSTYFNSCAKQWPIIKEFIDIQAIREAAKNEKP